MLPSPPHRNKALYLHIRGSQIISQGQDGVHVLDILAVDAGIYTEGYSSLSRISNSQPSSLKASLTAGELIMDLGASSMDAYDQFPYPRILKPLHCLQAKMSSIGYQRGEKSCTGGMIYEIVYVTPKEWLPAIEGNPSKAQMSNISDKLLYLPSG
jgi:hypothetical protein